MCNIVGRVQFLAGKKFPWEITCKCNFFRAWGRTEEEAIINLDQLNQKENQMQSNSCRHCTRGFHDQCDQVADTLLKIKSCDCSCNNHNFTRNQIFQLHQILCTKPSESYAMQVSRINVLEKAVARLESRDRVASTPDPADVHNFNLHNQDPNIWVTSDGRLLPINSIPVPHLKNIVAWFNTVVWTKHRQEVINGLRELAKTASPVTKNFYLNTAKLYAEANGNDKGLKYDMYSTFYPQWYKISSRFGSVFGIENDISPYDWTEKS